MGTLLTSKPVFTSRRMEQQWQRMQAVKLSREGMSATDIARHLGVSSRTVFYWLTMFADQTPGILGHHIAESIEAIYGASALAFVLQNDQFIRDERSEMDEPGNELAPFDANTRAGLFVALQTCLNAAHGVVERMYSVARECSQENAP